MTAAFIILAHQKPEQVARLAKRLAPHYVFVHIDSKVDESLYNQFYDSLKDCSHVKLIKRYRSAWASWGIVAAKLEGLKAATAYSDWSHVMVISGQDYPLISTDQITTFFNDHIGKSFVPHWRLPSRLWGKDGGLYRVRYWHMPLSGRRFFIPIPRRQPKDIMPIGGSMFWCLSRHLAEEVLLFTERRSDVTDFYQHVWIPDELNEPTVVMNSQYADSVLNEALTYIRWSNPGSPHPDNLNLTDGTELIKAGVEGSSIGGRARKKLFARKIDATNQPELLDFLDQAVC